MWRMKVLALILLAVAGPAQGGASSAQAEWESFIKAPSNRGYRRLASDLASCRSRDCSFAAPPPKVVSALIAMVNKRNRKAIGLSFRSVGLLDGGELEDLGRSLGAVADWNPELFLREAARLHQPDLVRTIVCLLPESVIDDEPARAAAVLTRLRALSRVTDKALSDVRSTAIACLKRITQELEASPSQRQQK